MDMESENPKPVPMAVISTLARTQGWVRFFSVLGFIIVALMVIAGIGMLFAGGIMLGAGGAFIGLIYMAFAGLYFYPALKLSQYASRIAALRHTQSERDLVAALEAQRSFWTFTGIMTVIVLGLYLVLIVAGIAFGMVF